MNSTSPEINLATIELAAKQYASDRGDLAQAVTDLNNDFEALKRKAIPIIALRCRPYRPDLWTDYRCDWFTAV